MDSKVEIMLDPEVVRVYWEMEGVKRMSPNPVVPCESCGRDIQYHIEFDCKELKDGYHGECSTCGWHWIETGFNPIPLGVEALAFYMRDKCDPFKWEEFLVELQCQNSTISFCGRARVTLRNATPEQWIRAAVMAWETKQ